MLLNRSMLIAGKLSAVWRFTSGDKGPGVVLSDGNRTMTQNTGGGIFAARGTLYGISSGKYYGEATATGFGVASSSTSFGIANAAQSTGTFVGAGVGSCGYLASGDVRKDGSSIATYATYVSGSIIGWAVDLATLKIWFSKDGAWQSGDPRAGAGGITISADTYYGMCAAASGGIWTIPGALAYLPPPGYRPL